MKALKVKLDAMRMGTGDINSETRISELVEVWWAGKQTEGLKYRTLERLRGHVDRHIVPRIGGLRVREATTARLDVFIRDLLQTLGPTTTVQVRSALMGVFTEAQRHDAVVVNPVAATRVPKRERGVIRALSLEEFLGMRRHAEEQLRPLTRGERLARAGGDLKRMGGTNRAQTPLDVIDFLIGTGCRASEPLGLQWADVHLDDEVPWVRIRQQVIREKERGLVLAPTKEKDVRNLALPGFAVEMLRRRQQLPANDMGLVFTNVRNNLIDPSNMRKTWRSLFAPEPVEREKLINAGTLDEMFPWHWVTQKTLRKTVATLINLELGSEVAATQLGHTSDQITRKHYIEKDRKPSDQRSALEKFNAA
ncbi:tyrosine-type recombinase/integrase [Paenarthrobacter sp. CAP02]|uniref:tyrosine-type recombinase/integrase n=1 Tax=Paenarthrobacter sp. CAP02 TaxID=3158144 RepID=UPI0032D9C3A1